MHAATIASAGTAALCLLLAVVQVHYYGALIYFKERNGLNSHIPLVFMELPHFPSITVLFEMVNIRVLF
jgi:hypothetical protein